MPTRVYSLDVLVRWYASNGTLLGSRNYDYNYATDYRCLAGDCSTGAFNGVAYVYLGL